MHLGCVLYAADAINSLHSEAQLHQKQKVSESLMFSFPPAFIPSAFLHMFLLRAMWSLMPVAPGWHGHLSSSYRVAATRRLATTTAPRMPFPGPKQISGLLYPELPAQPEQSDCCGLLTGTSCCLPPWAGWLPHREWPVPVCLPGPPLAPGLGL